MKKMMKMTLVGGLILAAFSTTLVEGEETGGAGTSSDPLVTKSYVDEKINDLKEYVQESLSGLDNTDSEDSSSQYQVILVPKGSTIVGGEGTEMILRSGTAKVVSSTTNGLVNMTTGEDALNGTSVAKNNLMIVPRDDGRGMEVTSDNTNIMVRGSYEIR